MDHLGSGEADLPKLYKICWAENYPGKGKQEDRKLTFTRYRITIEVLQTRVRAECLSFDWVEL